MQKDHNNVLSIYRSSFILIYYYVVFSSLIPQIVYKLQISNGIITEGTIRIEYQVLAYLMGLIPIIIVMIPFFKKEKCINFKKIIITLLSVIILSLILNVVFNFIIKFINNGEYTTSSNQAGLNELMKQNLLLHHIMVIVLAPCLEELVFRGVIFKQLRNKYNFCFSTLISSILFGFIHVSNYISFSNLIEITYLFLYVGLGFLFCLAYEYNKTIYACILIHMLYNAWTLFI